MVIETIELVTGKMERRLWLLVLWLSVTMLSALGAMLIRLLVVMSRTYNHLAGMV